MLSANPMPAAPEPSPEEIWNSTQQQPVHLSDYHHTHIPASTSQQEASQPQSSTEPPMSVRVKAERLYIKGGSVGIRYVFILYTSYIQIVLSVISIIVAVGMLCLKPERDLLLAVVFYLCNSISTLFQLAICKFGPVSPSNARPSLLDIIMFASFTISWMCWSGCAFFYRDFFNDRIEDLKAASSVVPLNLIEMRELLRISEEMSFCVGILFLAQYGVMMVLCVRKFAPQEIEELFTCTEDQAEQV
ncbi:hypothetical protein QQS21_007000 [Conoideocrella luteorostrata]|uniref:Transmembrane protein n=1 Tax=Conoideocrella luteorostrata TaxID=1105319 RepID=A0AAJ0CLZ0_9HYPO|nr:hypothetical protein QQS21_007000 [Conoideocrella luteorostrata]